MTQPLFVGTKSGVLPRTRSSTNRSNSCASFWSAHLFETECGSGQESTHER